MGKFHLSAGYLLGLFCAAAAAVPALAAAGTVSVDVSPTTGYTVTNRSTVALPPKATSGPIATYNPTLGPLSGGGAYQTTRSGITITAIDQTSYKTTMSGRIMAGASAMKNGLTRCLTSFRCNLALTAGAAGVQSLFNGLDWVMGEGGQVQKTSYGIPDNHAQDGTPYAIGTIGSGPPADGFIDTGIPQYNNPNSPYTYRCPIYAPTYDSYLSGTGWVGNNIGCFYGASTPPSPDTEPVSPSDIKAGVQSNYVPSPSDLPFLSTGGLDFSAPDVNFEIVDIPSITGANSPTYIENSDGTSTGTYSDFEFSWTPGPSKQPDVNVEETHHKQNYSETGQPTDSSTTTVVSGGSPAPPDTPTDCDFMPTVCRFIDWFTEPDPEINQDVDFSQLIDDVEVDREFSVGSSTAACPAPFVIDLSWVPSVEVSLQPFCDFADLLRPVLLAIASIFSGMIILRT